MVQVIGMLLDIVVQSAYDAGLFYCPYVPLQMVRAISESPFNQGLRSRHVTEWQRIHLLR